MYFSVYKRLNYILLFFFIIPISIVIAQPEILYPGITIKELGTVSSNSVRIQLDPVSGNLYTLQTNGQIKRVNFNGDSSAVTFPTVYQQSNHGLIITRGMTFGPDGTLYIVGNRTNGSNNQLGTGTIVRGISISPGSETRNWDTLAQTVEYLFGFTYDHRMSGIIVDPNNNYVYVNSGARTDHGEERQNTREVGLTSVILKLPTTGKNIILQNDREWLRTNGYLMSEGTRNSFDFAYSGNGDLFALDNSGDRDDPEELNWIQEGHHYGFPWNIGGNNTPQQFSPYNPMTDPLLSPNAWGGGNLYATFYNDPDYPSPPGVTFTGGVMNAGPDADKFRDTVTGDPKDASNLGVTITTFTTHRSPNGLVFDEDSLLIDDLAGGAFVISLNTSSLAVPIGDTGEDLLHVALTKNGDEYTAVVTQLVTDFNDPLGIEMVGNKLYIMETGLWFPANPNPTLWEITLPSGTVDVAEEENLPASFELYQNYPNPFNPVTNVGFRIANSGFVNLKVYDVLGNEIAVLVNEEKSAGIYEIKFDASALSSGVYFYKLNILGESPLVHKMVLMK